MDRGTDREISSAFERLDGNTNAASYFVWIPQIRAK
jgi:hypothetical protein